MINVSIYGSCVSRGVFDIPKFAKNFNVVEYIAKNSIFNLWDLPIYLEVFQNVENPKILDWNTSIM